MSLTSNLPEYQQCRPRPGGTIAKKLAKQKHKAKVEQEKIKKPVSISARKPETISSFVAFCKEKNSFARQYQTARSLGSNSKKSWRLARIRSTAV